MPRTLRTLEGSAEGGGLASGTQESRARQRLGPRASPRARAPRARDTTPARTRAPSKPSPPGVARSPPARPRPQRVPSPLPPLGRFLRGRARDGDDVIAPGSAALPRPAGTFEGRPRARPRPNPRVANEPRGTARAPFAGNKKRHRSHRRALSKKISALTRPTPHARAAGTGVLRPARAREQRAALRPVQSAPRGAAQQLRDARALRRTAAATAATAAAAAAAAGRRADHAHVHDP